MFSNQISTKRNDIDDNSFFHFDLNFEVNSVTNVLVMQSPKQEAPKEPGKFWDSNLFL